MGMEDRPLSRRALSDGANDLPLEELEALASVSGSVSIGECGGTCRPNAKPCPSTALYIHEDERERGCD